MSFLICDILQQTGSSRLENYTTVNNFSLCKWATCTQRGSNGTCAHLMLYSHEVLHKANLVFLIFCTAP